MARAEGAWSGRHNHASCVADAMTRADGLSRDRGVRLTELRRKVLALVWSSHRPIGAYAILDALKRQHEAAAPPTVYRALDFLMEQGLVHRIQSLNAYIGCSDPEHAHHGVFLICRACGNALEIEDRTLDTAIRRAAGRRRFAIEQRSVEAIGLCPACADTRRA
ncbi:MAG: transcriptional repressor [Rhodospirillales bacterium]|nr:transcriptional repressor [Rhodospirillales bacterium]